MVNLHPLVDLKISGARGEGIFDAVRRLGLGGAPSTASDSEAALFYSIYTADASIGPPVYASGTSFTITGGDVSRYYATGRYVRASGTLTGTIYGTVSSSSYNSGLDKTTVNVTWGSGSLSNETLTVALVESPFATQAAYAATLAAAKAMFPSGITLSNGLVMTVAGRSAHRDGYQGDFAYKSGDTTTTFTQDGEGFVDAQGRRFFRLFDGPRSVDWYKSSTDQLAWSAAITAAGAGGIVFAFGASYSITSTLNLLDQQRISGIRGTFGGVILSVNSNIPIFSHPASTMVEHVIVEGFTFTSSSAGNGCAIGHLTDTSYFSTWEIRNNTFRAELKECLYGNFILCSIHHNVFGYYGTPGAQHRHIFFEGIIGQSPNRNTVYCNKFYQSAGCRAAIYVGNCNGFTSFGNNIEANNNTQAPIELRGCYPANFEGDHIENNAGTYAAMFIGNDNLGASSSSYLVSLRACWLQVTGSPTAVLGQDGASSYDVDGCGGTLGNAPLYYSQVSGLTTGIASRGINQFVNEGGNLSLSRAEFGGQQRWFSDGVQYHQTSGSGSQAADATTLWNGRQSGLSTNSAKASAVSGLYYVLNNLTATSGQVVWKFERGGSTHIDVAARFNNAADSSSRTWVFEYTYDLTGATGWTNMFTATHSAGTVNGEGSAPFGFNASLLIRWRQTAGDDANSHTSAVGLETVAFQNQVLIGTPAFA